MSEQQTPQETYVDIKESYVNEKLREFFETDKNEVNIDNICLFSAKTVEEYNELSEHKLKGQQKLEAAVELAKRIVEKTVNFVHEDQRRQVVKNIYYNIDSIPQTIEFICRISGNPNLINANKWVLNKVKKVHKEIKESKVGFLASLCCRKIKEQVEQPAPEDKTSEPVVVVDKKKIKEDEKRRKAEERLQKELEELRMTPEEKQARAQAVKDEAAKQKKEAEDKKKAAKEAKIQEKKDREEKKRLDKLKKKEQELEQELNKIKSATAQETPAQETPAQEAPAQEVASEEVVVEA
jgi:hypothetical protein